MVESLKNIICSDYIDDKEKELVEKIELEHKNYYAFKKMTEEATKVLEELFFGILSLPLMHVFKIYFFLTKFYFFSWIKVEDLCTSHHKKGKFLSKIEAQIVLKLQIFLHGLNHMAPKDFLYLKVESNKE
jgi:hypothetical protein